MILAHFFPPFCSSYLPKALLKFRLHVSKFYSMKACCVLFFPICSFTRCFIRVHVCVFLPPTPSAFWASHECQAKLGQVSHSLRHKVLSVQLIFPRSFPPAEVADSGGVTLEVKSTGISWAGIDFFFLFSFSIWHRGVVHVYSYQKLTEIHSELFTAQTTPTLYYNNSELKNWPFSQCYY